MLHPLFFYENVNAIIGADCKFWGGFMMVVPYKHEPFTDFSVEENKKKMLDALKQIETDLGKEYPLIIGGERITTDDKIVSVNPANKKEVIGYVSKANKEIA